MIYLDNAATTKLNPEVMASINQLYHKYYLNANSPYLAATKIFNLQEKARTKLGEMLNIPTASELIFTASGSEANNMAIKGIAFKYLNSPKKNIITSRTEHSSVYEAIKQLEEHFNFTVDYVDVNEYGEIDYDQLLSLINEKTILVSIMKVNSELGTINYLEQIYDDIKKRNPNTIVHCDCVQALGKMTLPLAKYDLASFSAHKINGIKGSGLLYKKSGVTLLPLISGGEQENQQRAGTSNYYYNIVWAKTLRFYLQKAEEQLAQHRELYQYAYQLLAQHPAIHMNSTLTNTSYFIINIALPDYQVEVILNALEERDILVATQSACSTKVKTSRVLASLPIKRAYQDSALRISMSLDTTKSEIDEFYTSLCAILEQIERK
jgi:cysteine desulfurase